MVVQATRNTIVFLFGIRKSISFCIMTLANIPDLSTMACISLHNQVLKTGLNSWTVYRQVIVGILHNAQKCVLFIHILIYGIHFKYNGTCAFTLWAIPVKHINHLRKTVWKLTVLPYRLFDWKIVYLCNNFTWNVNSV